MFLVDDLLLSPIKGIFWVFQEIYDAARQEQAGEGEALTAALSELYLRLETGQITETEFDAREKELLDRLDLLEARDETASAPAKKSAKPRKKASVGKAKNKGLKKPRR
ncbi:MAG: gas vesicle protein GvpG [Deltaproteobacteria bacterium]|nr:MAG: gas vesicle protein GvpG [Deltaproteobacteria bacterium]